MSLMSHRTTRIRQEWTEEFSVTYLLVGSGNLLRYLFRNTHVTKSAFLLLCNSDDVCDRDLLGAFVRCMHACSWRYFYCLHCNMQYTIQGLSQRYSHAGTHTTGVKLRCVSPCAVSRSAASSVPPVGAKRFVEQAQNLQAEKLVWTASSSQCRILR